MKYGIFVNRFGHLFIMAAVVLAMESCGTVNSIPASDAAALWYNLGNAYNELGKQKEAVEAYSEALALNPNLLTAGYNLARIYIHLERYQESEVILDRLLETDPDNRIVLETKAWLLHLQDNNSAALEIYDRILRQSEISYNSLYNSAAILTADGEYERALERFLRIEEYYPEETGVLYDIAFIYAETGEPEKALNRLDELVARGTPAVDARELRGDVLVSLRRFGDAVEAYETALTEPEDDSDPIPDEIKGRILFKTAEILLVYIEDAEKGLEALSGAVEAGWRDSEAFDRILADTNSEWYSAAADIISKAEPADTEDDVSAAEKVEESDDEQSESEEISD